MQYTAILSASIIDNFHMCFFVVAQNIDNEYSLEPQYISRKCVSFFSMNLFMLLREMGDKGANLKLLPASYSIYLSISVYSYCNVFLLARKSNLGPTSSK